MMIVLTYDIDTTTTDGARRLQHMAKACEARGTRVQDSVYEMLLDPRQLEDLKREIAEIMKPAYDSVRIYRLGKNYLSRIELLGNSVSPVKETLMAV